MTESGHERPLATIVPLQRSCILHGHRASIYRALIERDSMPAIVGRGAIFWHPCSLLAASAEITVSAQQASPLQKPAPGPAFRAGVDVVSLSVTVTDGIEPLRH